MFQRRSRLCGIEQLLAIAKLQKRLCSTSGCWRAHPTRGSLFQQPSQTYSLMFPHSVERIMIRRSRTREEVGEGEHRMGSLDAYRGSLCWGLHHVLYTYRMSKFSI